MGKRGPRPARKQKIVTPLAEIACPDGLDDHGQREHSLRAAELRAQGRLTRDCSAVLEAIALAYQRMHEADACVKALGLLIPAGDNGMKGNPAVGMRQAAAAEWRLCLQQAGLTPATLTRLEVKPTEEPDELERFRVTG